MKYNLACGSHPLEGFTNVDIIDLPGIDLVMDLEAYPWDIPSESADEVYISHFIEHVFDLIAFMDEVHRILKPGGLATVIAPYVMSTGAWQDPTHKRGITEMMFFYFNKEWRNKQGLGHYKIKSDFDFEIEMLMDADFRDLPEKEQIFAFRHYYNAISEIKVTMKKRSC